MYKLVMKGKFLGVILIISPLVIDQDFFELSIVDIVKALISITLNRV